MSFQDGNNAFPNGQGNSQSASTQDTEHTQVFTPIGTQPSLDDFSVDTGALAVPPKRHHIWPWIVGGIVILLLAAGFGTFFYFQGRALPGTTVWGKNVTGKTAQEIATMLDEQVDSTRIPVSYNGTTSDVSVQDLGITVDSQAIAQQAVDAKRNDSVWNRYAFWSTTNIAPSISVDNASSAAIDEKLGTDTQQAVDAKLTVDEETGKATVVASATGSGADPKQAAQEAVESIESFGTHQPQTVDVTLTEITPTVTDDVAQQAADTINTLVDNKVGLAIDGHEVAQFTAQMLVDASRIEPDTQSTLKDTEARNGVVVFEATELQKDYENDIKPNFSDTKEDREVIVNGYGTETEVISEGHDGVKVKEGTDSNVGEEALTVLADGKGTVELTGEVDPMEIKKTKRHVVVDLSDHKVYAYENDKLVKAMSMSAGQGNDYATGECNASGDLCTPTGDFEVWLKYPSQDMSGTLTLSDGKNETWDVKDVGYVNYFSKTGCAIHRIATSSTFTDAQIAAMGKNTSHGCVGIGWDVAEWFYDFCGMGTSVHVQQ